MTVLRLFLSAVSQADVDALIDQFRNDVLPVFEAHPDCLSIELVRAETAGVGGLIEGGVLTRWTSSEAMEAALVSDDLVDSQIRVRELLRREPIRRVYEVLS